MNALTNSHTRINTGTRLIGASVGCMASAATIRTLSNIFQFSASEIGPWAGLGLHLSKNALFSYGIPTIGLILGTALVVSVISQEHFTKDQLEPTKKLGKTLLYPAVGTLLAITPIILRLAYTYFQYINVPGAGDAIGFGVILPLVLLVGVGPLYAWPVVYSTGIGTGMLLARHLVNTQALDNTQSLDTKAVARVQ